ncbi:MAG: DUF4625 domain-containing protein [Flavobacteriales bacterium]|nr:DUF4625 domain-containing protein [Flavobacteriales bacterium]
MIRKACLFFFTALLIEACDTVPKDEEEPVITSYQLNEDSFSPGETLTASISGKDNEELGQVRARIREASSKSFGFWELVEIRDLSGSTFSTTFSYQIPDTAFAGLYELSLQVSDERGNGSIDSTLQFLVLQEGEAPDFVDFQTNPAIGADNILRLNIDDTLTFSGFVADVDSVNQFSISFKDNLGSTLLTLDYQISDTVLFNLQENPDTAFLSAFSTFPSAMELKAQDLVGHQSRQTFGIEKN